MTMRILVAVTCSVLLLACSAVDESSPRDNPPIPEKVAGKAAASLPKMESELRLEPENAIDLPYSQPAPAHKMARADAMSQQAHIQLMADTLGISRERNIRPASEALDRENYQHFNTNPVHLVAESPVSTFSIDVDTASYSNVRRLLNQGQLPRQDAVRVEEMVNYFSYSYPNPDNREQPFAVYTEIGPSPWHPQRHLLHIGIKGRELADDQTPPANLVFLIDVSGSMQSPDKLDLLKASMKMLVRHLDADDRVAIAVYAGAAGTVLEPTPGNQRAKILAAIDQLTAGGSTNGGAGIQLAYALAQQEFIAGGINRVILATDGDFNVGTTDQQALKNLVEAKRESGVALSVLGFGTGNYNDSLMQELAQTGNGNAAYIDTLSEARKVLVDERTATFNTIARDVKIQIEFNPQVVAEYRLIGYESRHLNREDFNNDAIDAGDIGAGHTVTALYEISLHGTQGNLIDPLRYAAQSGSDRQPTDLAEIGFLKLRYKPTDSTVNLESKLMTTPLRLSQIVGELSETSDNYRFSAAVAGFGQLLRGGAYTGDFDLGAAEQLASHARGADNFGYRGEFLMLIRTAQALSGA